MHKIHEALEKGKDVRMVFLDISKAFGKVWHKGLIYKLEALGVRDPPLRWIKSYLTNRKQRVMISGQCSDWKNVGDGVPQGSVLGPLLFLVYINDITSDLSSDCFLFADDTSMLEIVNETPEKSAVKLNNDLSTISKWSQQWLVTMNASKTRTITFTVKKKKAFHPTLRMNGKTIDEVFSHTHLGLILTSNLSWKSYILDIHQRASKRVNILKSIKYKVDRSTRIILYKKIVRPIMEYANVIWDDCTVNEAELLENVQYEAARVASGAMRGTGRARVLEN